MSEVALSLGCLFSDRIEALLDGRVEVEGYKLAIDIVEPQRLFRKVLRDAAYDVAELSMASHIAAVGRGDRSYVGIPVFPSRSFRHSNVYVRLDRVARPEDLAGKRIGLIDFHQTAALWVRGVLADEHGVTRESVEWIAAGLHEPVTTDRTPSAPPGHLRVRRSAETLDYMLRTGAVDAVISPTSPRCYCEGALPIGRLWPDAIATEAEYFKATGIFPIMHVLVVRRTLAEACDELPRLLADAFEQARRLAIADRDRRDFPKIMLPWASRFAAQARDYLGSDPWTYGIAGNEAPLAALLRYAVADGLAPPQMRTADLFQ